MRRIPVVAGLTLSLLALSTYSLKADVRADEKSRVEFGGLLGGMMNMFGGKAAKEGVTSTVAVKGDRRARLSDTTGQIVDLTEEKIYDLDMRKKSYTVMTFEEYRRKLEEARKKAEENARKQEAREKDKGEANKPEKEMQIDLDVKQTGQKKAVNGFDTHEVILTVTVHEKGKTIEQSGGMVMTSDMWVTPTIKAMQEVTAFEQRYATKLNGPMAAGASAEQMAAAMAMYPGLKDLMAKASTEGGKLDGTAMQTTTTIDTVKTAEEIAAEKKNSDNDDKQASSGGLGGLMGGFAKKMAQKKAEGGGEPKARSTFMTMNHEVLKVTTDVGASDVAIPAGFKENK